MSLSPEQEALIADRLRVWHVRRACQAATPNGSQSTAGAKVKQGDAALDALLRCLLYELSGDIAAVTLLDQSVQYFLAVVRRSTLHIPQASGDMRKWYGCQSISHEGGLCVRTITMNSDPAAESVFEIFDLTDGQTRLLPVVDGTAASFRHYIGVPLSIRDGLRIGTLFVFKDEPAQQGLSRAHRHFMHETARQVVDQIELSVEALESKRASRCSSAVLALLHASETNQHPDGSRDDKTGAKQDPCSGVYQHAAKLLTHALELKGAIIQELPWSIYDTTTKQPRKARLLGRHCEYEELALDQLPDPSAEQLLKAFPSGAICHLLHVADGYGTFAASIPGGQEFSTTITVELLQHEAIPDQFVFLPLLNTYHHRHTAFIYGWVCGSTRVYASATDLLSLSAFGMSIMSRVRQIEEQMLNRKKNDFLGSVSHEMRSPLHGVMACLDLAREADSRTEQLELIDSATSCAIQLGDNIDNLLTHANIGSPTPSRELQLRLPNRQIERVEPSVNEGSSSDMALDLTAFIEQVVSKEESKSKSTISSIERYTDALPVGHRAWQTTVIVDSTPSANLCIGARTDVDVIITNLLSNCLKLTGPSGCIRVSVDADGAEVRFLFSDSACGISPDFVKHKLFVPFTQQDPLDPGMGLGLSLVHGAVQRLNGTISFQTDEAEGTDFSVSLPRAHFYNCSLEGVVDFSALSVQLLAPQSWRYSGEDRVRNQRRNDTFFTALQRTLSIWCLMDLQPCADPKLAFETRPDVMFVFHSDLDSIRKVDADTFDKTRKLVLCPDKATERQVQSFAPTMCVTIVGLVVPRKVISALRRSFEMDLSQATSLIEGVVASVGDPDRIVETFHEESESHPEAMADGVQQKEAASPASIESGHVQLSPQPKSIPTYRDPKLLLVDDNAINLKVLEKFAKKCSKLPSISASGGRAAIEAFGAAWNTQAGGHQAFDIILLDLSMPEVSGFDVAAAVRELELEQVQQDLPRTYIVALTGLISDKDRDAAFAAGVDEYVTKPASIKDLQTVVENWRMIKGLV